MMQARHTRGLRSWLKIHEGLKDVNDNSFNLNYEGFLKMSF